MSARDVVADTLLNEGCGDSDQCDKTAARVLSALAAAGYEVVPREPTQKILQAAAQLDFSAQHNPTWREFYQVMLAAAAKEGEVSHGV